MIPKQLKGMRFNRVRFKDKRAFEKAWQNNPYSYDEISKYFPKENYGVLCGAELRALDDDSPDKKLINLFVKNFGETFRVRDHFYFKFDNGHEDKIIFFDGDEHLGELQGEGTYVVGAGSIHPSGEVYDVRNDLDIITISYDKFIEVFADFIKVKNKAVNVVKDYNYDDDDLIKQIKDKWNEGDRQNLTLSLAGYLRKTKKFGLDKALGIVEGICEDCKDFDFEERKKAVEQTYAKDEDEVKGISGLVERDIKVSEFDIKDYLISKGINAKTKKEEFKVNVDKFADYIVEKHNIKTWFGKMNDYSFNFNGRVMCQETRGIVKIESQELLGSYCSRNISAEIFEKVKAKSKVEREDFEKDDNNLIPLFDGVWDLKSKTLLPHSPDFNFTTNSPISYDKKAKCPIWDKFINETLYPEDVPVMQEWFGFNLYRRYFIKKGVICEGDQDTGKSVLLDTLVKLVGEKNKTGLSLQKITSGSDFTKLSLKNKWSNVYDDLSSKDLCDGGAFKVATGGGYISGEEKFGEYQQFKSYAKQMFATNKIPPVKDNDDLAYFGRWIVFRFDNVPEKLDPFLRDKLWSEEELSGILNWALEGLYRLLDNGKFSYKKNPEEIKAIMERSGCPLVAFSSDVLERNDGFVVTKEEMFKAYTIWCEKNKRPRLSKEMLGRQLTKYCPYILAVKQKGNVWKNAKIKAEYLDLEENDDITDTSDTFQKTTRNIPENVNNTHSYNMKVNEKVSEVSAKQASKDNPFCPKCNSPTIKECNKFVCFDEDCGGVVE